MSLGPVKVRVEIFREPAFFDDSFAKGWTTITGSFASDGDAAVIIGFGAVGRIEKDITDHPIDTDVHAEIQVRISHISGAQTKWGVKVYDDNASVWITVWTGQLAIGLFEEILPAGKNITKIALIEETSGDITNRVDFDYVGICKNVLLVPDLGYLVDELTIVRPLLNSGIAGAKLSIPNFARALPYASFILDTRVFNMGVGGVGLGYVSGATVKIYQDDILLVEGLTDENGKYSTMLNAGTYQILISKTGYLTIEKNETLERSTELMVNLPMMVDPKLRSGLILAYLSGEVTNPLPTLHNQEFLTENWATVQLTSPYIAETSPNRGTAIISTIHQETVV